MQGRACRTSIAEGMMKTWLTVSEGATYSGVSRDMIYAACKRRELRHARISGRRAIRLKVKRIDAWLEQHAPRVKLGAVRRADASGEINEQR
jgi:excisionase family DNA binding protein